MPDPVFIFVLYPLGARTRHICRITRLYLEYEGSKGRGKGEERKVLWMDDSNSRVPEF